MFRYGTTAFSLTVDNKFELGDDDVHDFFGLTAAVSISDG